MGITVPTRDKTVRALDPTQGARAGSMRGFSPVLAEPLNDGLLAKVHCIANDYC